MAINSEPRIPSRLHVVEHLIEHRLPEAFMLRDTLVNYKKAMFHLFKLALETDKSLRRLNCWFYCSKATTTDSAEYRRKAELSDAIMRCRGAKWAIEDARRFTKAICCLPRHPANRCPPEVLASITADTPIGHKILTQMGKWLQKQEGGLVQGSAQSDQLKEAVAIESTPQAAGTLEALCEPLAAPVTRALLPVVAPLEVSSDQTVAKCMLATLIANGGAKALW
jgi:hypothetical protein